MCVLEGTEILFGPVGDQNKPLCKTELLPSNKSVSDSEKASPHTQFLMECDNIDGEAWVFAPHRKCSFSVRVHQHDNISPRRIA